MLPVAPEVTFALAGRSATKVRAHATGNSSCRVDDDDDDDDDDDNDGMPEFSRDVLIFGPETAGVIVSWILYTQSSFTENSFVCSLSSVGTIAGQLQVAEMRDREFKNTQWEAVSICFHLFPTTCRFTMIFNDIFCFWNSKLTAFNCCWL